MNGQPLRFDLLGLYKGVFLMSDRTTGTVWAHLDGAASQGPLAGERLSFIPMPLMKWSAWREAYPNTTVLDWDTPYQSWYSEEKASMSDPNNSEFGDSRLPFDELVVGVEANGVHEGFPISELTAAGGVVNTEVGGVPVVVVYDANTGTGIAFKRTIGGEVLSFVTAGTQLLILVDEQTSSSWTKTGQAITGTHAGDTLEFTPSFISMRYGWSAYHPETSLYAN